MVGHPIPILYRALYFLLKFFFHLLYGSFAWSYDFVARVVSLGMWEDWVLAVIPDLPGPCVLEIGHGTGWLQAALMDSGISAFGVDSSAQMGRIAHGKAKKRRKIAQLVRAEGQQIPFPSISFDQVAATFPSEYIFDPKTLAEIYRVLKPGGTLVVVPVAWIKGEKLLERLAAGLFRLTGQAGEWDDAYLAPFHRAGFECTVSRRVVQSSQLLVIEARKPARSNSFKYKHGNSNRRRQDQ